MQEVLSQQLKCKLFHCLIGFISTDWAVEITKHLRLKLWLEFVAVDSYSTKTKWLMAIH